MRGHIELITAMSAVILALCGCGDGGKPALSLEEYAKRDCAIGIETKEKLIAVNDDFLRNVYHPDALADTVRNISPAFNGAAAKYEELGDPPNGEGKGGTSAAAEMLRHYANQVEQVADLFQTAHTQDEFAAAGKEFQNAMSTIGPRLSEFKAAYPTPELDKAESAIPGCLTGGQ